MEQGDEETRPEWTPMLRVGGEKSDIKEDTRANGERARRSD